MNLQASKIKASRTKTAWKSAENSKKTAEKSVNPRVNFGKNKKASRIKALREFAMKRLADFFWKNDWKTGKKGYNKIKNAVNTVVEPYLWEIETLRPEPTSYGSYLYVEPYLWEIETCRVVPLTLTPLALTPPFIQLWLNRTYERLKLKDSAMFLPIHWLRLNRTYERLKQDGINTSKLSFRIPVEPYLRMSNVLYTL